MGPNEGIELPFRHLHFELGGIQPMTCSHDGRVLGDADLDGSIGRPWQMPIDRRPRGERSGRGADVFPSRSPPAADVQLASSPMLALPEIRGLHPESRRARGGFSSVTRTPARSALSLGLRYRRMRAPRQHLGDRVDAQAGRSQADG